MECPAEEREGRSRSAPLKKQGGDTDPAESGAGTVRRLRQCLRLSSTDQFVTVVLGVAVMLLMVVHWVRLGGWGALPVEIERLPRVRNEFALAVNRATAIEWAQLDGIGEVLAQRIVDDRRRNGDFEQVDDLLRVDGIGPRTLEQIRPWLTINPLPP